MSVYDKKCAMEVMMDLISGKWKILILWRLSEKTLRFNELRRLFPNATQKMLTQQLRNLESDGLVLRTVYAVIPPKVEYSLTDLGKSLIPVIRAMTKWGNNYLANLQIETSLECEIA
jgi:DNA-binding HxlR family transcriptional regulator